MAFNKNEVLLDRVRSLTCHDLETNEMLLRLTSLEDPSLATSAEGEEITDAIGALITTLYRAKRATFSASNSLVSLDLAAAQYGAKKVVAGVTKDEDDNIIAPTVTDYAYEILTAKDGKVVVLDQTKVENKDKGKVLNVDSITWVYTIAGNEIGTGYSVGLEDSVVTVGDDGTIELPAEIKDGTKIYVEYTYQTPSAVLVTNKASNFPEAVSVVIYAYFRDVCNENKIYSGKIICPKAKLSPESVELALTSTGKHPFEFVINRDYCAEEGEDTLFEIILSE